jgi:hypothetical protein
LVVVLDFSRTLWAQFVVSELRLVLLDLLGQAFYGLGGVPRGNRKACKAGREDRILATRLRSWLIILDEIDYTPLERTEATFPFEVIAKRYDHKKSIIVTSNKNWGAWGGSLPDQIMTAAILDRLLHRSVTLNILGCASSARPPLARTEEQVY